MKILLLASWSLINVKGTYYIPQIHKLYLDNVCEKYNQVFLVAPVKFTQQGGDGFSAIHNENLHVIGMPYFHSYLSAQKYLFNYYRAIREAAKKVDLIYCRVPDPFAWMPALITDKPVIMHFVGDTIDAVKNNQMWSPMKRRIMSALYKPESAIINIAAKRATKVLTNGEHIATKLKKKGIKAIPIISSTVSKDDFPTNLHQLQTHPVRLTYVGYLRGAKGIDTLIKTVRMLHQEQIDFVFNIVGIGDKYEDLKSLSLEEGMEGKLVLWGFINDRSQLFNILRHTDLFYFPSLSEGSPRVIIEAMSQGVPVMSTPVGSLPSTFKDPSEIRFFPLDGAEMSFDIIQEYIKDNGSFDEMRRQAMDRVKQNYTTEVFFNQIFKL